METEKSNIQWTKNVKIKKKQWKDKKKKEQFDARLVLEFVKEFFNLKKKSIIILGLNCFYTCLKKGIFRLFLRNELRMYEIAKNFRYPNFKY